jgi:2-polyprenyl-3-methyl-5-hydroxy-6-metoxy-1,4-benzoquinol methylase
MGIIGGTLAVRLLDRASKKGTLGFPDVATAYLGKSKIEVLLGAGIWDEFRGRDVIDFGCGDGVEAVEIAVRGARRVVGIEIRRKALERARARARDAGVQAKCHFVTEWYEPADYIVSLDAFEHFADPAAILRTMHQLLKPKGAVLASFGPIWRHPLGGHIYSVFPYAHLLISEAALVRWRAQYKHDGATSIESSGLNRMTIRRFEELVAQSPLRIERLDAIPIRRLRALANRLTREFTTATVRCRLVAR